MLTLHPAASAYPPPTRITISHGISLWKSFHVIIGARGSSSSSSSSSPAQRTERGAVTRAGQQGARTFTFPLMSWTPVKRLYTGPCWVNAWDLTFALAGERRWPGLSSRDEEEEESQQHRHRGISPVALPAGHRRFSQSFLSRVHIEDLKMEINFIDWVRVNTRGSCSCTKIK